MLLGFSAFLARPRSVCNLLTYLKGASLCVPPLKVAKHRPSLSKGRLSTDDTIASPLVAAWVRCPRASSPGKHSVDSLEREEEQ